MTKNRVYLIKQDGTGIDELNRKLEEQDTSVKQIHALGVANLLVVVETHTPARHAGPPPAAPVSFEDRKIGE